MSEVERLDAKLAQSINAGDRTRLWDSAKSILSHGPTATDCDGTTVLALGHVQSGKTTSITALAAAAADAGYQVIVALLGSTNLLLDQNRSRLEKAFEIETRSDYVWTRATNPSSDAAGSRLLADVRRGRTVLVSLLKHAGRIESATKQLANLPAGTRVLIIDDEADQASLNTSQNTPTNGSPQAAQASRTYSAIRKLRNAVPSHLYVQYTATPYAPLLLDAADILHPDYVEFLTPGTGYTGGKEFFIDHETEVVRKVPLLDEQASKVPPLDLQDSLHQALSSFLAGAVLLMINGNASPPISMLVHSTARNDVQQRYEFLIRQQIKKWAALVDAGDPSTIPESIAKERQKIVEHGVADVDDNAFVSKLDFVLEEATTWLVNSTADINRVDWHVSPIHILIGGNKLDRGFTVEGLTVTYMNRPASPQVDTLEQRARAFGYRGDLLPYCQFFGSRKTVDSLTAIVHTEADLRARLLDHVESDGTVHTWAQEVGLLLPENMLPTRSSVVNALSSTPLGWHAQRIPDLSTQAMETNTRLLAKVGLLDAPRRSEGRLSFRTLTVPDRGALLEVLGNWMVADFSPGWIHDQIVDAFDRKFQHLEFATLMLMEAEDGGPRVRRWDSTIGFVNLFQGRDQADSGDGMFYPGDRNVLGLQDDPDQLVVQVHRTVKRDDPARSEVFALAIHLGAGKIVRK